MFHINTYLEKFKKMEPEGDSAKRAAEKAIFETLGIKVGRKDISVKNTVLHISAPAALKNEIFMNKRGILQKTKEMAGTRSISDIR
jgi:hypothetical protein